MSEVADQKVWLRWLEEGGVVDLSARTKLRLSGGDRVRYLNGQVTNDIRAATPGEAMYACVTDAKGRIAADVFVHAASAGEALLIDAEGVVREALAARLERYIVSDDAEIADFSDEWRLWHVFGVATSSLPAGAIRSLRFGIPGADVWRKVSDVPPTFACSILSEEQAETLRIVQGVPRWPNELSGDTFPQEAGLEARAMSYTKGCYIGQEVLSRIRSTGRRPRELVQWKAQMIGEPLAPGCALQLDGKVIGHVTSSSRHPETGLMVGLGFVKQGAVAVHSILLASMGTPSIEVEIISFLK